MSDAAQTAGIELVITETPPEVQSQGVFADEQIEEAFKAYLQKEITSVRDGEETQEFLDTLIKHRRQRLARPENKTKNYPFPNSANVSPPITAQKVNTIYAKALSNFSTKRPFWSGETSDVNYRPHVEALAKYMNFMSESPFELHLDSVNRKLLYECISLGTIFYEVSWDYEQITYMEGSTPESPGTPKFRVLHNGPKVTVVPIEDFLTRPYWTDLQKAPWLARRFRLTRAELLERGASGRYKNVDLVMGYPTRELTDREREENETQGIRTTPATDYPETEFWDLYQFHAYWDVNGDGVLEDVKGVIELESGLLLRTEMNNLGVRLFGRIPYQEIPGMLYGIGVCHACEYLQDEAEMLHNQRLDNLKWSMLNMFTARRGSGINPRETIEPGKIWFVDQADDFKPMLFPDLSGSSYQAESLVREYADRITGANDPMSGFADQTLKSGGGAQAQMMMTQQASSILNAQLDTMEEYYSEMGRMLAMLLAANVDLLDFTSVSELEASLIKELLSVPLEDLPSKVKFRVDTTDAARSESAKRDNYMAFMQMYDQYVQSMSNYLALTAQIGQLPVLGAIPQKFMVGRTKIMEKMVEFLKLGDPKDFLPYLGDLEMQLKLAEEQREAQVGGMSAGSTGQNGQIGQGPGIAGAPAGIGGSPMAGLGGQPGAI